MRDYRGLAGYREFLRGLLREPTRWRDLSQPFELLAWLGLGHVESGTVTISPEGQAPLKQTGTSSRTVVISSCWFIGIRVEVAAHRASTGERSTP